MTITLGGGVSINCIYYTIFSKVLCLSFCQTPSRYQDIHMQIICGNPDSLSLIKMKSYWSAKIDKLQQYGGGGGRNSKSTRISCLIQYIKMIPPLISG